MFDAIGRGPMMQWRPGLLIILHYFITADTMLHFANGA